MRRLDSDRFSPAAQRVLQRAWALARLRGIEEVPLDSLLDGLRQEEGVAREILEAFSLHERHPADLETLPPLPPTRMLSDDVRQVIDAAESWVRDLGGHVLIGSEHLLYGHVQVDRGFQARCDEAGLTTNELSKRLTEISGFTAEPLHADVELIEATSGIDDEAIALRVVDASLNRVGEGLRVVEDYFRFGLNDAFLSEQCKAIRHDLQPVLRRVGAVARSAVRDVAGDVGTEIVLPTEQVRGSAEDVAAANLSRVCESLRSAEEYAKTQDAEVAVMLEQLRYRTYDVERIFQRTSETRRRLEDAHLYLLTPATGLPMAVETLVESALAGGVDVVQLREKTLTGAALLNVAHRLRTITREAGALLVINDRPDIAVLCDADGVHVGQDDLSPADARRIIGSGRLIGVSTHGPEDALSARQNGADYLGVGPTFPSETKSFETFAGLDYVRHVAIEHTLPAFAIGGVTPENVGRVVDAGLSRVAVSRAITHAEQPEFIAKSLARILRGEV